MRVLQEAVCATLGVHLCVRRCHPLLRAAADGVLTVNLQKARKGETWAAVFKGHAQVSYHERRQPVNTCVPSVACLSMTSPCRVRRRLACPQLDELSVGEERKALMLERFQAEHAGFDFSGAEFSGAAPDPQTFMGGVHGARRP